MRFFTVPRVLVWALMIFCPPHLVQAATQFTFVDIVYPGATGGTGINGINNAGQAVGSYVTAPGGSRHGFLYSAGTYTTIDYPGALETTLTGISGNGAIVGLAQSCPGNAYGCAQPFIYNNGVFTLLADPPNAMPASTFAWAINNSGQVAGWYVDPCFCRAHSFIWSGGVYTQIDRPGYSNTSSRGLNDLGDLPGASFQCWGCSSADGFILKQGTFTQFTIPGASTEVTGINNLGDFAGNYSTGTYQTFAVIGGVLSFVEHPDATQGTTVWGQAINDAGQLGGSYVPGDGVSRGFIATPAPVYNVCLLYDQNKAAKAGSTIPIKLQLCDASGANLSLSTIALHASNVVKTSSQTSGLVLDSGNANPDNNFRFDSTMGGTGGYILNLSTKGLTTGSYTLSFHVDNGQQIYVAPFQVK